MHNIGAGDLNSLADLFELSLEDLTSTRTFVILQCDAVPIRDGWDP